MRPQPEADVSVRSAIRRIVLVGAALILATGLAAPSSAYAQQVEAPTTVQQALRPTLPRPTGDDRIGVVPLHLVDWSRPDPWVSAQPVRELMLSLWYPARRVHGHARAPWLPPAAWARFEQDSGVPPGVLRAPLTHAAWMRRSIGTPAAGRWCFTRPGWVATATAAPCWLSSW